MISARKIKKGMLELIEKHFIQKEIGRLEVSKKRGKPLYYIDIDVEDKATRLKIRQKLEVKITKNEFDNRYFISFGDFYGIAESGNVVTVIYNQLIINKGA